MTHGTDDTVKNRIIVIIGGIEFSLPVENVVAIADMADVEPVPAMPFCMAGMVYYKDTAIPVSRMRCVLGIKTPRHETESVIIIETAVNGATVLVGAVVDAIGPQTVSTTAVFSPMPNRSNKFSAMQVIPLDAARLLGTRGIFVDTDDRHALAAAV